MEVKRISDRAANSGPETARRLCPLPWRPTRRIVLAFVAVWSVLATASLLGGPALGDHEVIVAQIARQTLQTGEWVVLHYLDTPFLVKPPLSPWLVSAISAVLPGDPATGNPVSTFSSRLPSAIATLGTILMVFALGRSMFGRRAGVICSFVYATSFGPLFYAFNATAEALLTFFCTWAFAEFWWSRMAGRGCRRHLARYHIALGLAMLTKGPMPLIAVALPIAVWWWSHRAGRVVAFGGPRALPGALRRFAADFWPRLRTAMSSLGLWWGVPLFLLMFLPWMIAVGRRVPYFWSLWDYEYLDRFEGQYPGSKSGNYFYYVPIAMGLMLPWALSVPHALAAPFLRGFRNRHRPLSYVWYWAVVGIAAMSLMSFKKPYYILPATPALALLLGPVIESLFFVSAIDVRRARLAVVAALAIFAVGAVAIWVIGVRMYPEEMTRGVQIASALAGLLLLGAFAFAGFQFVQNHRFRSFTTVGATGLCAFTLGWYYLGPAASNIDDPLEMVRELDRAGVPANAELYWAGNRPDGRVLFYGNREVRQVVDPYRLIAENRNRVAGGSALREIVGAEICNLLEKPTPVYCVMQREDFGMIVKFLGARAEKLFSVDRGNIGDDKDDWIISANPAGVAKAREKAATREAGSLRVGHLRAPLRDCLVRAWLSRRIGPGPRRSGPVRYRERCIAAMSAPLDPSGHRRESLMC